jgi:hypothetical protein
LAPSPATGWQYLDDHGFLVVRLPSPGPHRLEIPDARPRLGTVFPTQLEAIAFDFGRGLGGWMAAHEVENLRAEGGRLKGLATGSNPYLHRTRLRVQGRADDRLRVAAQSAAGASIAVYWITADSPDWGEDKTMRLPFSPGPDFNEYVFAVGQHFHWAGRTIIGLRLDPVDGSTGGEFAVQSIRAEAAR